MMIFALSLQMISLANAEPAQVAPLGPVVEAAVGVVCVLFMMLAVAPLFADGG